MKLDFNKTRLNDYLSPPVVGGVLLHFNMNKSFNEEKEMSNKYCVYIHTNKINGKRYIGQTCQTPKERWANGKGYNRSNSYFKNAIEKYGWDNFDHLIIADKLTREEANQLEIHLIAEYQTTNKEYGYNIQKGGTSITEETIKKLKSAGASRILSEDTKKKIGDSHRGTKSVNYGKPLDTNIIEKLRNNQFCKHVKCIEYNIIFKSAGEASRHLNCHRSTIIHCCNKDTKTAYGLHWEYTDEECTKDINIPKQKKNKVKKAVKCIETQIIYTSALDAEKKTNINNASIGACCKHKTHTAGGYHWKYVD